MRMPSRREFLFASTSLGIHQITSFAQPNTKIKNRNDWRQLRTKTLTGMQLVMGRLPKRTNHANEIHVIARNENASFKQLKILYKSELNDYVDAHLLIPNNIKSNAPAMLCLHQTTKIGKDEPAGLGGNRNLHYAKELAERGYVCIVPDYPYLGENVFDPYKNGYLSCTMKGIFNHMRAVDVLQSLSFVDKKRIGSIGHSLGGHNTLFVAAFDERISAIITSCGFTKFDKYYNGNLQGWSGIRYMPRVAEQYDNNPAKMPFDFPEMLASCAPRPIFINAPLRDSNFDVSGVRDCEAVAVPVYDQLFNAREKFVARYPDTTHDFPKAIREEGYAFLDRWLKTI